MEDLRFDALARSCGSGTRRSVLRLLAGTGVGALVLGRLGIEDAAAACVAPGRKCKTKKGPNKKCCGGAKCKGGRCKCKNGGVGCGKGCCEPGQICLDGKPQECVNGPLQPGEICDPEKQLGCDSGKCVCVTVGEQTACTCREVACKGFATECAETSECCQGFCSEFEDPPTCQPGS